MPTPPRAGIQARVFHCWKPPHNDKVYVIWIENRGGDQPFFVCGAYGPRTIKGMLKVDPKGQFSSLYAAQSRLMTVLNEKVKKGYQDVEYGSYSVDGAARVSYFDFVKPTKIDTSRIVGYGTNGTMVTTVAPVSSHLPKRQNNMTTGRASRSVEI